MASLGEVADETDNGFQRSPTRTGLRIWAGQDLEETFVPLPVLPTLDDQASCCTITTGLLKELACDENMSDKDKCPHEKTEAYKKRIVLLLFGEHQTRADYLDFCLLQGEERLVVMTGREKCLQHCPQVIRWAGLAADPKTNGQ